MAEPVFLDQPEGLCVAEAEADLLPERLTALEESGVVRRESGAESCHRVLDPDPMHPPEDGDEQRAYFEEIAERITRIPGVRAVGMSSHALLEPRGFRVPVVVEGQPTPVPTPQAWVNIVSPDFFDAAGIARAGGTSFGPDGGTEGDA